MSDYFMIGAVVLFFVVTAIVITIGAFLMLRPSRDWNSSDDGDSSDAPFSNFSSGYSSDGAVSTVGGDSMSGHDGTDVASGQR